MRIALLGSSGVPALGYFAAALDEFDVTVFLNGKIETQKDIDIWNDRTEGRLPPLDVRGEEIGLISRRPDVLREFDLAINGGLLEILKGDVLSAPRLGILNVHPGILPKYRGCTAVEWALYNDDPIGCTAHLMDEGIDTGPIVCTDTIEPNGSYQDIRIAVYELMFRTAARAVRLLDSGLEPTPQGAGTYWKPIPPEKLAAIQAKLARRCSA